MLMSMGCLHGRRVCVDFIRFANGGDVSETGLKLASRVLMTGVTRLRGFVALVADRFVRHEGRKTRRP